MNYSHDSSNLDGFGVGGDDERAGHLRIRHRTGRSGLAGGHQLERGSRTGVTVEYRDADGRVRGVQARVIDFDKPTRGCQYARVFIQRMGRTMKRQTLAALALVGALTLAGCMSAIYTPPQTPDHDDFRIIVNSGYERTWTAIIDHVSQSFFTIENFEKDSGLITLSFGSDNPSLYIDCGYWKWRVFKRQPYDGPYVGYLQKYHRGTFSGRMNISARPVSSTETEVRVNARYVLSAPPKMWSFDSGSSVTIAVPNATFGTPITRTCVPTYYAEQDILSAVKRLAE